MLGELLSEKLKECNSESDGGGGGGGGEGGKNESEFYKAVSELSKTKLERPKTLGTSLTKTLGEASGSDNYGPPISALGSLMHPPPLALRSLPTLNPS